MIVPTESPLGLELEDELEPLGSRHPPCACAVFKSPATEPPMQLQQFLYAFQDAELETEGSPPQRAARAATGAIPNIATSACSAMFDLLLHMVNSHAKSA